METNYCISEDTPSSLMLKVEVSSGTSLRKAIIDAKTLANKLNLSYVIYNFHVTKFYVSPSADVEYFIRTYNNNKTLQFIIG